MKTPVQVRFSLWLVLLVMFAAFSAMPLLAVDFSLSVHSPAGEPMGRGVDRVFDQTNATAPYQYANPGIYLYITPNDQGQRAWTVSFSAPASGPLKAGTYDVESSSYYSSNPSQPMLLIRPFAESFSRVKGQFEVKKMTYSATGFSAWITFTQYIDDNPVPLTGEFKYNSEATDPAVNQTPAIYLQPDRSVPLGKPTAFKALAVDDGLPSGTLNVTWRVDSSAGNGRAQIAQPNEAITDITFLSEGKFTVTATATDGALTKTTNALVFVVRPDDEYLTRLHFAPGFAGQSPGTVEFPRRGYYNGPYFSFNNEINLELETPEAGNWRINFSDSTGKRLFPGKYPIGSGSGTAHVSIGKASSEIVGTSGTLEILQASYDNSTVTSFYARFILFKDDGQAPVTGEVRYHVPPDAAINAPLVSAGPSRDFSRFEPLQVRGSVLPGLMPAAPTEIHWSKVSGPGDVIFASPDEERSDVTVSERGMYVLRLTAMEGGVTTSSDVEVNSLDYETFIASKSIDSAAKFLPQDYKITATASGRTLTITASKSGVYSPPTFQFMASEGSEIEATSYTATATYSNHPGAGLSVPAKAYIKGKFQVLELTKGTNGEVLSCWVKYTADTVQDSSAASVSGERGEIRYRVSDAPVEVNKAPVISTSDLSTDTSRIELSATVSDDLLPYGVPLTYRWELLSGPSAASFSNPLSRMPDFAMYGPGIYRIRVTVSDGEFSAQDEKTIVYGVSTRAYEGLATSNGITIGSSSIQLTANGAFSAKVLVGKTRLSFQGKFKNGGWSRSGYTADGNEFSISFSRSISGDLVVGTLVVGATRVEISTRQVFANVESATHVAYPFAGRYTAGMLPGSGSPVGGGGYGEVNVGTTGKLRLVGKLGDGVPFSASANALAGDYFALHVPLRGGREYFNGLGVFSQITPGLIAGQFNWARQQDLKSGYPSGFASSFLFAARKYSPPAADETVFRTTAPVKGRLSLFDITFPEAIKVPLEFTATGATANPSPAGFSIAVDRATGYVRGSFVDPQGKTRKFGAVVQQSVGTVFGQISVDSHTGGVLFTRDPE